MKKFILIRGVSGSGKTSLAKMFERFGFGIVAADDFFIDVNGNYKYEPEEIAIAHAWCQERCLALLNNPHLAGVVVHNTSTRESDVQVYQQYAESHGFDFVCMVLENRHGNSDIHNVPEEALARQEKQLRESIQLRYKHKPEQNYPAVVSVKTGASVLAQQIISISEESVKKIASTQPISEEHSETLTSLMFARPLKNRQGGTPFSEDLFKLMNKGGMKIGEVFVIGASVGTGKSQITRDTLEMTDADTVTEIVLGIFFEDWMTDNDKKEFIQEVLKLRGVTAEEIKYTLMTGVALGYPLENQIRMLQSTFRNLLNNY